MATEPLRTSLCCIAFVEAIDVPGTMLDAGLSLDSNNRRQPMALLRGVSHYFYDDLVSTIVAGLLNVAYSSGAVPWDSSHVHAEEDVKRFLSPMEWVSALYRCDSSIYVELLLMTA